MKPLKTPDFVRIGAVALCVLLTALAFFLIGYHRSRTQEIRDASRIYEKRIVMAKEDIAKLDALVEKYKEGIHSFEKILFKEKDIPLFLEDLSRSSKKFNVALKNLQAAATQPVITNTGTGRAKKEPEAKEEDALQLMATSFAMNIEGEFRDVLRFLISLERSRQLLTISDVKFTAGSYPTIQGAFQLDLYSLGDLVKKKDAQK